MAGLYWEARSDPGVDSAELIASQKDWLRRIWRECGSGNDDAVTCLEDEYEARIAVLDSLG
jgi:hypothetical protein